MTWDMLMFLAWDNFVGEVAFPWKLNQMLNLHFFWTHLSWMYLGSLSRWHRSSYFSLVKFVDCLAIPFILSMTNF